MSWDGAIFFSLGTKPATRELLSIVAATDFQSMALPSVRDSETPGPASQILIGLVGIIGRRTRLINLARAEDISAPGSGDNGSGVSDASNWRSLASLEFRSAS